MTVKKTALYSSLWASCDELRGGMDASQYKDYVLALLFMKYVSDKDAGDPYAMVVVPEDGSFEDMVKLKGDKEIGDRSADDGSSDCVRLESIDLEFEIASLHCGLD